MSSANTVVVAGDVMIDWNLSVDRDKIVATRSWADAGDVHRVRQYGGAWLLEDLIRQLAPDAIVRGIVRPASDASVHQTYTVVTSATDDVLRVHEFLGVERSKGTPPHDISHDDPEAAVVALLDSDLGFEMKEKFWPAAIRNGKHTPWVILKTSVPAFHEKLWQHLAAKHADRLIVVMTADDLRRKEIQLIRRVSWERTAQDVVTEIRKSTSLHALRRCKYLIVSFGPAGAMVLPRDDEPPRLVFDPSLMEREWAPPKKPSGHMIGYATIAAAAVTHEVMLHPTWPQLADALPRAIAGMRALFESGFGKDKANPEMPLPAITQAVLKRKESVSTAVVHDPSRKSWSILEDRLSTAARSAPDGKSDDPLYELAARVAIYGPDQTLAEVPQLRIGDLFTVDREEIEAYRSVKALLSEYVDRTPSKPLSIAVFGSPGSGKSFGVVEIAKSIGGQKKIKRLTFNLTQFARYEDLHGAFHQVRDVSLKGEIPLVFWDEFDTTHEGKPLGWLRYFIGPMQDGEFQEDQVTHPIGTSIFVFAGGTAASIEDFMQPGSTEERKALKVPDFVSRLKGFLNVIGPNRRNPNGDPHYLIRRAILLRSMLLRHCKDLFRKDETLRIAPGVLRAFLTTKTYLHGARSLESVIAMSMLAGRKRFESSSLPPEPQMALHVELPFVSETHVPRFTDDIEVLEKQAKYAHDVFCETKTKQGWHYAEVRNDGKRRHNLLVEYEKLPEHAKEANRGTVRWIPRKLENAGYTIAPAGSAEERKLTDAEYEQLAKMEHDIWMNRKKAAGYVKGDEATDSPKHSPYLVPWSKLPTQWKDVDRAMVRAIPQILALAGYILVEAADIRPEFKPAKP
ncbi:MAG TPA: RyR domain-containing protein [Thermoanaerobaculia bacterium]|nr:RyR domain-containing protein [Thermoanaerobaculia bacterium]